MPNSLLQNERKMVGPTTSSEKKVRVQLDFEAADMQIINDLVIELDLGTRAELFRSGLRALRWMVQKKKQRCVLTAIAPDGQYLVPEFDFLDRLPHTSLPEKRPDVPQNELQEEYMKEASHA